MGGGKVAGRRGGERLGKEQKGEEWGLKREVVEREKGRVE